MNVACLFDLDGTILDSRKCGTKAMEKAFIELYNYPDPLSSIPIAGRTDLAIFTDVVNKFSTTAKGRQYILTIIEPFKQAYLKYLKKELSKTPPTVFPGIKVIFDELSYSKKFIMGLATGNFKAGAELKLIHAGINPEIFKFGSFGDDSAQRTELLGKGIKVAAQKVKSGDIIPVVIGDTPEDYRGAKQTNAKCVLVATGPFSYEEISQLNPEFITKDFSNPYKFLNWLNSLTQE